ncbi:low temperature requirement protein A [Paracoccus tegillarcae]|uniref:Low temperature requirement protein A n=1 Tax=Paracoccus tegillarcae TaxID=1529068 RepID=A0A2K9EUA1_9RHOB|nr:low temperature requirement protein A [Paracoccus tegillarcae]AUH34436.1 hypothetical protein CUV01_14510 [Paracoccus tegillarcae]
MAKHDHPFWRKPKHHLDAEHTNDHVHWVELFYDLIHVVTIFMLGNYLSHHLDVHGFLVFTGLFLAVWYAWADNTIYNSVYVSTDILHRIGMALQIITVMIVAASIPAIGAGGWPFFALGYAMNRAITAAMWLRAAGVDPDHPDNAARAVARNFAILAAVFALSAILPRPLAYWVFGLGLLSVQLQYVLPRVGTFWNTRITPRLGHISERFALLILILIGEGFFKLVVTLSEKGIYKVSFGTLFNLAIGGISLFVMAWVYFDSAGNAKPKSDSKGQMLTYWFAHIVLMLCCVLMGVALAGEVYVGFLEPYPYDYAVIGCIGLVGFLGSLTIIQSVIVDRDLTRKYHTNRVRLFGIAVTLLTLLLVPYIPSIIGNLLWGTALFSQIAWPLYRAIREMSADDWDTAKPDRH